MTARDPKNGLTREDALLLESLLAPCAGRRPPSSDTATDFDLDRVLARVSLALPGLAADVAKPPADLLSELLAIPERNRRHTLAMRAAFRSPQFFDHIRETALTALPQHQSLAEALATLCVQQAQASHNVELSRRHLLTAYCVFSTLRRLRGEGAKAEAFLARAGCLLTDPHPLLDAGNPAVANEDRALYLRSLALLRWEQGTPTEAHALFSHASHLARPAALESVRSKVLMGLLHLVEGVALPRPLAPFQPASSITSIDPAHHPLLALLARLGLALATAEANDLPLAAEYRRQAREQLFPLLIDDPAALAYPSWLDARIATLTDPDNALACLKVARTDLLHHEMPWAATLATVDAVLFLARNDRVHLIPEFLVEAPLPLALPPAVALCQDLAQLPVATLPREWSKLSLRREAARLPSLLRRVCLLRGIAIEPLPFV